MTDHPEEQPERLRWQCRRGMLEVDLLLNRFLDEGYGTLTHAQKLVFTDLLAYPDQVLVEWLMGRQRPVDRKLAHVVDRVRNAFKP